MLKRQTTQALDFGRTENPVRHLFSPILSCRTQLLDHRGQIACRLDFQHCLALRRNRQRLGGHPFGKVFAIEFDLEIQCLERKINRVRIPHIQAQHKTLFDPANAYQLDSGQADFRFFR